MNSNPTGICPCDEPECLKPSAKILKFNKLSNEQQADELAVLDASGSSKDQAFKTDGKSLKAMCLPKLKRAPTGISTDTPTPTSIASTFLAAHALPHNTTCIIDPLKVLHKSPMHTLLARPNDTMKDSSYLAEALKNFEKQSSWVSKVSVVPSLQQASCADLSKLPMQCDISELQPLSQKQSPSSSTNATATTTPTVETRTISSSYISANEEYDEHYHEVSDGEGDVEVDADAEAYPGVDHYVTEAKSKDSFLNILYEDALTRKPKRNSTQQSISDLSNDSIMLESGYKSNTSTPQQPRTDDALMPLTRCVELVTSTPTRVSTSMVKTCMTDVYPICRNYLPAATAGPSSMDSVDTSSAEDSSEQISKLIVDLIGPNSRVGKLIFQSCTPGQDVEGIYEEIKQCVQAELQMEDKLANFFRRQSQSQSAASTVSLTTAAAPTDGTVAKYDSLRHLDETLVFVKEHLTQIRADLNEFKEYSYKKIDSKVSHTEFSDTTAILRAKMTYLERKLFNEHRIMRQDIRNFREKINYLENEAACGLKNFPIWPFLAFIGAYSIINIGRR